MLMLVSVLNWNPRRSVVRRFAWIRTCGCKHTTRKGSVRRDALFFLFFVRPGSMPVDIPPSLKTPPINLILRLTITSSSFVTIDSSRSSSHTLMALN